MSRSRWSWILMLAAITVGIGVGLRLWSQPAHAHLAPTAAKQAAPAKDKEHRAQVKITYTSVQNLGQGVTMAKLSNGLTVLVRENHAAPVATVRSYVANTGSVFEGKWLGAGLSHLVEHLVSGGSTSKRSEKKIEELIGTMGGRTNAYTSTDVTAYHIDCPAKKVNLTIELIADSMQFSTFPEKEYAREMEVVQRELEMGEQERNRVMYQKLKETVYSQHPMRHPIIGYISVLQGITRQDVIDFYKSRYVPQNMTFVVAGDVDTKKVLEQIKNDFKTFHRTTERQPILKPEPMQASPRSISTAMEGKTTTFSIGWPTIALQHDDLYPLDVASYVLTSGDSSRLVKRLRVEKPLAISVDSASYTPGFVPGWFSITVECKPENVEECKKIIMEEIKKIQTDEVPKKELDKVKRQVAAQHVFGQQEVSAQAESLARSYMSTGDPLFDEQYVKGIKKVTAPEILRVAKKYFVPHKLNSATIVPLGQKDSNENVGPADVTDSPVKKITLDNGMVVLLKKTTAVPLVNVVAFSRAGATVDTANKAGLANLAAYLMTKGTKKYSGNDISEHFDSIGGSLSTSSGRNTSYLTSAVLKEDFDDAFPYVVEVLLNPTFPEDEFAKAKQLQLASISARKANTQAEIMDFFAQQLPKSTPYSHVPSGTAKTVGSLTVDDCKEFHKKYFVPNNLVLAIYGDIDPAEVEKKVQDAFGKVAKGETEFQNFPLENDPLKKDHLAHLTNQKKNTGMVFLGFPSVSVKDKKDQATLEVLSGILTGGSGSGGRLFNELRGQGLVYYVFGFSLSGYAPGYYCFMAQTRPETIDEVTQRIRKNLKKIADEGVPADELTKVKEKLIAAHALTNTTASGQAFQAGLNELYGLGYDYEKSYDERVNAITKDDLSKLVKRLFDKAYVVTSSPETETKSASTK